MYTCGCIFHNFNFYENSNIRSVGYYIDKWDLKKKYNCEFVKIYDKHCNMIITNENSTCENLITIIKNIQKEFIDTYYWYWWSRNEWIRENLFR